MLIALLIIARAAQIGASMLLAGIFAFELVTLGPAAQPATDDLHEVEQRLLRLVRWSLIVAFLSALLWFGLEVANMSGLPLTRAFSTTAWQAVLFQTEFGRVWQLRLGLIVVALVLAALGFVKAQLRRALTVALFLVSATLLVSLAWISHAAAARAQPLGLLGDALHLCAAGAWIGGLLPLAIFLTLARASVSLGERAARVLQRFSTLSLGCVGVLVVSGLSNSWLLGRFHSRASHDALWLPLAFQAHALRHPGRLRRTQQARNQNEAAKSFSGLGFAASTPPQCDLRGMPRSGDRGDRCVFRRYASRATSVSDKVKRWAISPSRSGPEIG